MIEAFRAELREAVSRAVRSPRFTVSIVLTLAIGIGVNAGMLNIVEGMFFRLVVARVRDADAARATESIRRAVQQQMPGNVFVQAHRLLERVDRQTRSVRTGARAFTFFGILAVALAGLGLFSVVAYEVGRRRREFGIRSALGATPSRVLVQVLGNGLLLVGTGILLGLGIALYASPRAQVYLFGVPARDPLTYGLATASLVTAAVLAMLLPAWRAASLDPLDVLRED